MDNNQMPTLEAVGERFPELSSEQKLSGGVGMLNGGAIDTISSRQHLASSDMHKAEITAAATVMHRVVPARGLLQEARIPQERATPIWIDSASTIFVATNRSAPKKSTWVRRKTPPGCP